MHPRRSASAGAIRISPYPPRTGMSTEDNKYAGELAQTYTTTQENGQMWVPKIATPEARHDDQFYRRQSRRLPYVPASAPTPSWEQPMSAEVPPQVPRMVQNLQEPGQALPLTSAICDQCESRVRIMEGRQQTFAILQQEVDILDAENAKMYARMLKLDSVLSAQLREKQQLVQAHACLLAENELKNTRILELERMLQMQPRQKLQMPQEAAAVDTDADFEERYDVFVQRCLLRLALYAWRQQQKQRVMAREALRQHRINEEMSCA